MIDIQPEPPVFSMDEALDGAHDRLGTGQHLQALRSLARRRRRCVRRGARSSSRASTRPARRNSSTSSRTACWRRQVRDGVTVWGSMQCPYYIHKALMALFNLPAEKVRVVQMETGGGFGGKEEYPSIIAGHAALLAWKTGRPVKLVYDRAEDMVATTKRHPSRTRHRTAVSRDGRLLAMDVDFVIDGGAYCTLSPVVLSRGTIHSSGPYYCPNTRLRGRAVATNAPPHGAFRGFGAPQSLFALERHMDRVAAAVGLAPDELRRRNFIRTGQTSAVGQVMRDPIDMGALLDRALHALRLSGKARAVLRDQPGAPGAQGDRPRDVHARRGLHRIRRGSSRVGRRARGRRRADASACCPRTPRSVRAPTPSSRRLPRTRSAFRPSSSRSRSRTRRSCPTAARRSRPARAWSSASSSRSAAVELKKTLAKAGLAQDHYTVDEFRARAPAYVARFGPVRATAQLSARRRGCAGTMRRIRGTRTGPTRGLRTWPRCPSTCRRSRLASTISSPSRKSGKRHQSGAGHGTDRRRRRAGDRLGALRAGGLARGPDGERAR